MSDFYLREGDTASDLYDVLRDAAGVPVDIAGAAIRFVSVPLHGGTPKVDQPAVLDQVLDGVDGSRGKVHYSWSPADTDTPGDYLATWKVTFSGGDVLTFPNAGYLLVTVTPKAGDTAGYVSREELKSTLKLQGLTFADLEVDIALIAASEGLDVEYGGPWTQGEPGETRFYTPQHEVTRMRIDRVDAVTGIDLDVAGNGAYDRPLVADVDYRLEPVGDGPYTLLRWLRSGFMWSYCYLPHRSAYPFGLDALRVTGTFGAGEVPAGVKGSTTIIATRIIRRMRDAPFGGAIGLGLEGAVVRAGQLAKDPEIGFMMKGPRAPRRLVV